MTENHKGPAFRMLFLITTPKLAATATDMFHEGNVPLQYQFRAQGTASSEIMDMLGLGSIEKTVIMSMMPKVFADEMLIKLKRKLHLGLANSGVAFTISMSGGSAGMIKLIETLQPENSGEMLERNESKMADSEYTMIMAIVNQGYSEEVMAAAKNSGATGGTVFHSRRVGSEEAMRFWGITVQQEREIVLILVKKDCKLAIMKAIGEHCGMQSDAHGVALSMPVDSIAGLE